MSEAQGYPGEDVKNQLAKKKDDKDPTNTFSKLQTDHSEVGRVTF